MLDVAHRSAYGTGEATKWSAFARVFLLTFGFGLALLYTFILLVDPFGTGWFPALPIAGINDEDLRTADVYRGRDPRFDSAIIGNSTGQLLNPTRLTRAAGAKFVQLTIPGSGPREQFAVWRWFVEHHKAINDIVLVADPSWCTDDAALPILHPFPFWLYSDRWLDYGSNIFSMHSLDRAVRRLRLALGLLRPSDPTGYDDYERGRTPSFSPEVGTIPAPAAGAVPEADTTFSFPALDRLDQVVAALPPAVAVDIVAPPVFITALPQANTPEAARTVACKARLAKVVATRHRSGFIDMFRDLPLARDPANFMDAIHYRDGVAMMIEDRIARLLSGNSP